MRHRVVQLIVDRLWPLSLAMYALFAAIASFQGSEGFVLYAYKSSLFSAIVFLVAVVTSLPTILAPNVQALRWVFFIVSGFAMTGRILQIPDDALTWTSAARGSFVVAALLAHLVIQVDWMIEQERHDR